MTRYVCDVIQIGVPVCGHIGTLTLTICGLKWGSMTRLVRDVMKIGVPVCERATTLDQVARLLVQENSDSIIVMDEFGACGVVTQSDLVRAYPRNFERLTAEQVMTDELVTISPEVALTAAAHLMTDEHVHQVFVMHEHPGPSRPSAIVTMRAIVREMAGLPPEKAEKPNLVPQK